MVPTTSAIVSVRRRCSRLRQMRSASRTHTCSPAAVPDGKRSSLWRGCETRLESDLPGRTIRELVSAVPDRARWRDPARVSREHYEEVVSGDVLVEVDPARVGLDALARAARRLAARIVDLAVDLVVPDRLLAIYGGRGVEAEDRAASAEVRRQLRALDLAAAVELERDKPRERERPAVDHRRARYDRIGAAAGRRLIGDVERTLELGLQRDAVARGADRRLDEHLERRLRRPSASASGADGRHAEHQGERQNQASHHLSLPPGRGQPTPVVAIATSPKPGRTLILAR